MIRATVLTAVLVLAGCAADGGTEVADDDETRLARAMCNDLKDGMSLNALHTQAVDYYLETGRSGDTAQFAAAELEDVATREHCPEFRDEFEASSQYERWIAP